MANALTKQIMATIVERCEGYTPMKAAVPAQAADHSAGRALKPSGAPLNQREEALLSKLIHKQADVAASSGRQERSSYTPPQTSAKTQAVNLKETNAFRRDGVVSLDALIKEIRK